jgi:phospholipase C
MLENRSFDQMLGGMTVFNSKVDGVKLSKPYNSNKKSDGSGVEQQPGAAWTLAKKRDPDHEHAAALLQLGDNAKPMTGFVRSYLDKYQDATDAELNQVMAYFEFGKDPKDDRLPALHTLARNFAVCDRWFSSMPGPTWQNRFFVHSGTSLGHVLMPSEKTPQDMHIYYQETIFDRLSDANVSWAIFHEGIPQSIVMTRLLTRYLKFRGYESMDKFVELANGTADDFPEYSFIEPHYFGANENDQHPPADVRRGEQLIETVYNALRSNKELWESTLLVMTYDEHGGFYDHVSPPATAPPDRNTSEWSFDRLGVRVPTILVSPWLDAQVISTTFDHTSLLRYLCEKWNLPPLGSRMQDSAGELRSNTFGPELLKREKPRDDAPIKLTASPIPKGTGVQTDPPIEGSREALLMYVDQLPGPPSVSAARSAARTGATHRAAAQQPATLELSPETAQKKLESLREERDNTPMTLSTQPHEQRTHSSRKVSKRKQNSRGR